MPTDAIEPWTAALHIARRIQRARLAGLQSDPEDCHQLVVMVLLEAGVDPEHPDVGQPGPKQEKD